MPLLQCNGAGFYFPGEDRARLVGAPLRDPIGCGVAATALCIWTTPARNPTSKLVKGDLRSDITCGYPDSPPRLGGEG